MHELHSTKRFYFCQCSLWEKSIILDHKCLQTVIHIWVGSRAAVTCQNQDVPGTYNSIPVTLQPVELGSTKPLLATWSVPNAPLTAPPTKMHLWTAGVKRITFALRKTLHPWLAPVSSVILLGAVILAAPSLPPQLLACLLPLMPHCSQPSTPSRVFLSVGQAAGNRWAGFVPFLFSCTEKEKWDFYIATSTLSPQSWSAPWGDSLFIRKHGSC